MSNFHLADEGSKLEITVYNGSVVADLTTASTKQFHIKKPGVEAVIIRTAVFTTTGADGKLEYAWLTGDLDVAGSWLAQAYVISPTWKLHSDVVQFEVEANL